MPKNHRLPSGICAAFIIVLCGCNSLDLINSSDRIAGMYLGIGYSGYTSDVFLTLGDRDSLQAQAFSGGWPRHTITTPRLNRLFSGTVQPIQQWQRLIPLAM